MEVKPAHPGFFIAPFAGGRYYFNPKITVCLKLYGYLFSFGTFGATLGVTFGLQLRLR